MLWYLGLIALVRQQTALGCASCNSLPYECPKLSDADLVSYPDYFLPSGKIVWWTAYTVLVPILLWRHVNWIVNSTVLQNRKLRQRGRAPWKIDVHFAIRLLAHNVECNLPWCQALNWKRTMCRHFGTLEWKWIRQFTRPIFPVGAKNAVWEQD